MKIIFRLLQLQLLFSKWAYLEAYDYHPGCIYWHDSELQI